MARFSDDVLDQVRRSVDAGEFIGRYMPLKKAGSSWKGCCPFHQEKTPSFHVFPGNGVWKCFGCGVGGNVFHFLMKREGMSFVDAVREVARDGGVALPDDAADPAETARAARIARLRDVAEWACRHFERCLREPDGERARTYLKGRAITGRTAKEFRLGFAPPGWDRLLRAAEADRIPVEDLLAVGLVNARDREKAAARGPGHFDFFRDRVIFPIQDAQGRVIAFGGRTMGDDEPKYLNSRETDLFSKGRNLYALHLARGEMVKKREGAVMEGYTDVILAHQSGFKVAVAGLGTALTPDQAKRIAPLVDRLWLVYDGDTAGLRAAERAIPAFLPESIETCVCVLPEEKDPAEVFVEDGEAAFRECLARSKEAFEHLIAARTAAHGKDVPGRSAAAEECLEALVGIDDEVRRSLYVKRLADEFGIPEDVAHRRLASIRAKHAARGHERPAPPPRGPARPGPGAASPPHVYAGGASNGVSNDASNDASNGVSNDDHVPQDRTGAEVDADAGEAPRDGALPARELPPAPPPEPDAAATPVEKLLAEALLGSPDLVVLAPTWLPEAFGNRALRVVVRALIAAQDERGGAPDVGAVLGTMEDGDAASAAAALISRSAGKDLAAQGRDCLALLARQRETRLLEEERRGAEDDASEAEILRRMQRSHAERSRKSPPPGSPQA